MKTSLHSKQVRRLVGSLVRLVDEDLRDLREAVAEIDDRCGELYTRRHLAAVPDETGDVAELSERFVKLERSLEQTAAVLTGRIHDVELAIQLMDGKPYIVDAEPDHGERKNRLASLFTATPKEW